MEGSFMLIFWSCLLSMLGISVAADTIATTESIRDGQTIVSASGSFALGVFSPSSSKNRYVGIWYNKISTMTVVWVANREIPLTDSSGVLQLTNQGILTLLNRSEGMVWSSNTTSRRVNNPVAQLLDSGNLVVRDGDGIGNGNNQENLLWQSFDYPSDTHLPGMKLGKTTLTDLDRHLSSWKSSDDPSPGNYTYGLIPGGFPEFFLRKDQVKLFRSGPWNGLRFSGWPNLKPNPFYRFRFVFNKEETYFEFELLNSSVFTRMVLSQNGLMQRFIWVYQTQGWVLYLTAQTDTCDRYGLCGAYGSCNIGNSPQCSCLDRFVPKFQKDWDAADWSNGCVRRTPLDCQIGDGFVKYSGFKLPDTENSWFNKSMSLKECREVCLKNCSCMAYSNLDVRGEGSGCLAWLGELIDLREYNGYGQDIYIRMASSEIAKARSKRNKQEKTTMTLLLLAGLPLLGLGSALYVWRTKKIKQKEQNNSVMSSHGKMERSQERYHDNDSQMEDIELPVFDYATIANATDCFSINNKLGEGGFGPVYKGILNVGQEIAVKRLSRNSRQGLDEFKNEVLFIAKLQHRNLVKLLGCCLEVEKMLIYEYMPNKSLDSFIFGLALTETDPTKCMLLDWPMRFNIMNGVSRGLLYLHQDSRLRIIHRDLKASNILLDHDMNPRISDFGMARSFGVHETEANTSRVVGTYGYMSPEYAIDGIFSVKSDVFSFGVLMLEIVSGKRNRGFSHEEHDLNLLGHAWKLYTEGRPLDLIDPSLSNVCNMSEVLRSINVGLLCVQRCPEERPSMSSVVLMLGSESSLPQPKQPGFFHQRNPFEPGSASTNHASCSANNISFTSFAAR